MTRDNLLTMKRHLKGLSNAIDKMLEDIPIDNSLLTKKPICDKCFKRLCLCRFVDTGN